MCNVCVCVCEVTDFTLHRLIRHEPVNYFPPPTDGLSLKNSGVAPFFDSRGKGKKHGCFVVWLCKTA
jgi:hypothetical protein